MRGRCLFVIDVQTGFITDDTRHVPERAQALQADFDFVVVTRFVNAEGSMHRQLIGWHRFGPESTEAALAIEPRNDALMVDKGTYTGLTPEVKALLDRERIETVHLCGIATDNCVLKTAVDLFEAGIRPVIIADVCASHGGSDCHKAGLLLLRRFVGDGQIINAGF